MNDPTPKKTVCQQAGNQQNNPAPLPCLYSNNSTETSPCTPDEEETAASDQSKSLNLLTAYHRKSAHTLKSNVEAFVNMIGIEWVGFLTLTFADNVTDNKEASRRFNSMNSHFLASHPYFGEWMLVKERQKRGAWHYHILIDCGGDIRTGVNFDEFKEGIYSSAGDHLRMLWGELRVALRKYGFGRHELLPVIKDSNIIALYVGKYISKHVGARKDEDKGVRLVSYSRNWLRSNSIFQWYTSNSQIWRMKVAAFAEYFGVTEETMPSVFGKNWAYHLRETIWENDWPARLAARKTEEFYFPSPEKVALPFDPYEIEEEIQQLPVDDQLKEKWKKEWKYKNPHFYSSSLFGD